MSKQRSSADGRDTTRSDGAVSRRSFLATGAAAGIAGLAGCSGALSGGQSGEERPGVAGETLTLTTTTSTYDTGLLDAIHPSFEEMYGATVDAVAQGTGAALESARNGDSDVVMVHARGLEDEFMRNGYGINRRDLMFNDFVIVGPESDPAGIRGRRSATERSEVDLTILVQGPIEGGPEILSNPYGVMAVNPGVHENANYDLAMAYIGWITSPGAQDAIADYQMNGEQLFFPRAISENPDFQQYVPEGWSNDSEDE
jgi:ABC-type tungstate transport system permease subunit